MMLCSQFEAQISLPYIPESAPMTRLSSRQSNGFLDITNIKKKILSDLSDRISIHDTQISRLQQEGAELQKRMKDYESALSCVHRLPEEMLVEISIQRGELESEAVRGSANGYSVSCL